MNGTRSLVPEAASRVMLRAIAEEDLTRCRSAAVLTLVQARYECAATAGLGNNKTRKPPIVLQLRPETPYVAVYDAGVGHVVRPPQRVEDLLARDHSAGVGRQQVQQAVLQRGQLLQRRASPHRGIKDVDLELAQSD